METNDPKKPAKPGRKAVILCAVLSPLFYSLLAWSGIFEGLRPNNYSYGPVYYFLMLLAVLAFNAAIVFRFYKTGSPGEKLRACLKGTVIAFLLSLAVFAITALIYVLSFSTGHWNFG